MGWVFFFFSSYILTQSFFSFLNTETRNHREKLKQITTQWSSLPQHHVQETIYPEEKKPFYQFRKTIPAPVAGCADESCQNYLVSVEQAGLWKMIK